jgi:hypothetical protein
MQGPNQRVPVDWEAVPDAFREAWTSDESRPDIDRLARFCAPDDDVVIFDTLPPLEGFAGSRSSIHDGLARIGVARTGGATVTAYPLHLSRAFADGRSHEIDARISEVRERREGGHATVHEHPSTVYVDGAG